VLTADTYTSVLPCLARQAADATAALVRRAGYQRDAKINKVGCTRAAHTIKAHRQHPENRDKTVGGL